MQEVERLLNKYELLARDLRSQTGEDETAAITALAQDIGHRNDFKEIPELLARALGEGLSLEGVGECLSVGGSMLFLRSQTGNPMDVHINTGVNTRRYLLRQPELSRRIKLQALLMWNTGPEVVMAQKWLAPDLQPEPERVASLPSRTQDELLEEIASLIGRPRGEGQKWGRSQRLTPPRLASLADPPRRRGGSRTDPWSRHRQDTVNLSD